jgi:hypothetical protein
VIEQTCLNCRFFLPMDIDRDTDEVINGICRRYPPSLPYFTKQPNGITYPHASAQPEVDPEGWCGEYQVARSTTQVDDH